MSVCSGPLDAPLTTPPPHNRLQQQLQQNLNAAAAGPALAASQRSGASASGSSIASVAGRAVQASPPDSPAADGQPQYLRMPLDSARKLRWYDKQDLSMLIQLHLREKAELLDANAALRRALARKGLKGDRLDAELQAINTHVDGLRAEEDALARVLVESAQAEIESLRDRLEGAVAELEHTRQQLAAAQQQQHAAWSPPLSAWPGATGHLLAASPTDYRAGAAAALEEHVSVRLQAEDDGLVAVQLVLSSTESMSEPAAVLSSLLEALAAGDEQADSCPDPGLLGAAAVAVARLAAQQGVVLPMAGDTRGPASPRTRGGNGDGGVQELKNRCLRLELEVGRLQGELAAARAEVSLARDSAEARAAEQRSRVTAAHQQAVELLRVAQDGRLAAEERCHALETRLVLAEERATRLDSEAQDLRAEAKRVGQEARRAQADVAAAEARAAQAESALQREKALGSRAAELDARSAGVMAQQRGRLAELEAAAAQAARALAAEQRHAEAAERRAVAAEAAAAAAAAEAAEQEALAAERDELAARLVVLEGKLEETRAERGQVEAYRQLADTAEARRARAEDELVSTARLAAQLEARLAEAAAAQERLRLEAQAAAAAAVAAEQRVDALVRERWEAAGRDRSAWPLAAQEELENVEARLSALHTSLKSAERRVEKEAAARQADSAARAAAEAQALAAEDSAARATREARQREQRLEAAASAALSQVSEFRAALMKLERERDELLAENQARDAAQVAAATALAGARRRAGSGALPEGRATPAPRSASMDEEAMPVLPSPRRPLPEMPDATELLFLKNVLLKFVDAQIT